MDAGEGYIFECSGAWEANGTHQFVFGYFHVTQHGGEVNTLRTVYI
jgi:hypothetical protein